jgi:hypothetical protein
MVAFDDNEDGADIEPDVTQAPPRQSYVTDQEIIKNLGAPQPAPSSNAGYVTDPDILKNLGMPQEGPGAPTGDYVTDPELLKQLGAPAEPQQPQQPQAESPFWSGVREFAHGIGPTIAGAAAGAATMGGYGAAAGTLGLPGLGTLGGVLIGGAAGIVTGGIAGYAAGKAQDVGAKALGIDDDLLRTANAQANPGSTLLGGALPAVVPFGMGRGAVTLGQRAFSGALMGSTEAGSQYAEGRPFDPAAVALSTGLGAAFPQPRAFLNPVEAAGARVGARLSGAPAVAPHGTPGSDAAAGTAKEQPQPAGGTPVEPGAAPATPEAVAPGGDRGGPEDYGKDTPPAAERQGVNVGETDPAQDAAIRAKMEPEGEAAAPATSAKLEAQFPRVANAEEQAPVAEPAPAEPPAANVADALSQVLVPSRVPGMEGEASLHPNAEQMLRDPESLAKVDQFLAKNGIDGVAPLKDGYGTSSIVLDAGDKVVRLSPYGLRAASKIPEYVKPLAAMESKGIGAEIMPKLDTANITQADVETMQAKLAKRGLVWPDGGVDNLGRDAKGKLHILDGEVTKKPTVDDILKARNQAALKAAKAPAPATPSVAAEQQAQPLVRPEVVAPVKGRGPRAKDEQLYSLLEYLAHNGGLQKDIPELKDIFGGKNRLIPGFGNLLRKNGMSLDQAWLKATREGRYLNDSSDFEGRVAKTTTSDLLDLIDKEARGARQYRVGSEGTTTAGERGRGRAAELNRVAIQRAVDGFSHDAGLGAIDPKIYDRTVEIMEKEGVSDPDVAYERALMEGADQYEKANKVRDDAVGHIEGWDVDDAAAAREAGRGIREAAAGPEPAGAPTFSDAGEAARGAFEMGAEGKPQGVIPGTERIGEGELAQRRADERLRPTAPQRPADEGLFGDTHLQENLFTGGRDELMRQRLDAAEAAPNPAAHLRETAAMYRAQGQEGRARQFERAADAFERSREQQQQQQQRQPPQQPPGGRPPAGAPPPLGGTPPTQRPAPAPPARFPFLSKLLRAWQETFQPETISSNALRAEPVFAKMKSAQSGEHDRIFHETQEGEARWNKIPEADRFSFLSDVENGRTVKPEVKADAQNIRRMLDEADKLEKQWGSKAAYRDDYFPHEWEAPRPGQPPLMEYLTQTLGPTGFQKARTIDLIEQGLAAGYKLKNTNPYAAVRSRLLAGADMRMTMEMLGGLEKMQLAGKVKNDAQAATLAKQGWQKVNAPDREQWLISPEVQPIWNNVVAQRGLWGDPGVAGDAFRGWMQFKSAWVPIKLAVSAFHPLHVAHINMASNLARAADQAIAGDINGAIKSAKQAVTTTFRPAAEVDGKPISAKEVQNQWLLGENARTPEGKLAVQYMEEGGIIPRAPEQFRSAAEQRLSEAWQAGNPFKLAYYAPQELVRRIQAPIFDMWIPRVKVASFLNDAAALLKRRPDLVNNDEARGIALRALGKSTDNRYGEMFYNGLFWNKMAKDMGTGSLLSLGWNLGFAREFGGAAIEAATRPAGKFIPGMAPSAERQTIRDATNKIKFASIYMGTAAMIGGIMTKMFTGENPQDTNDYIFPRVGGVNPDGSPRRLTTMFYLREIPMLQKHVQEQGGGPGGMLGGAMSMLWNKTLFQPIRELVENRDYFGREVWDTNAPGYQQIAQAVRHTFGQQLSPMSVTGAEHAKETGGAPIETPLAYLGFGPAPAYAARTAIQNRIGYLYQNYVSPGAKPYQDDATTHDQQVARNQILLAKQNKDQPALDAAIAEARKAGMKPQSIAAIGKEAGDQYMFQRLPQPHQMAILSQTTPDERQRYWRYASPATRRQWNVEHQAAAAP